jgi:hypothetical protein
VRFDGWGCFDRAEGFPEEGIRGFADYLTAARARSVAARNSL